MSLPAERRDRIEEYVKPLYMELDGAQTFDRVEGVEQRLAELAKDLEIDGERLETLALFHGVIPRLGSLGAGGRWQIFLAGLGFQAKEITRLAAGLERFDRAPVGVEEELLHDAVLLDRTGVRSAIARLLLAGRKKVALDRAVALLDPGPGPERFRTARGAAIAADRQRAAEAWIGALRQALEAEGGDR